MILLASGEKACVKCYERPVMMRNGRGETGTRRVPGSYCRQCATEANRQSRARQSTAVKRIGKDVIRMNVSTEEFAVIRRMRETAARRGRKQLT